MTDERTIGQMAAMANDLEDLCLIVGEIVKKFPADATIDERRLLAVVHHSALNRRKALEAEAEKIAAFRAVDRRRRGEQLAAQTGKTR